MPKEKHYKDVTDFKQQINTSELIYKFLPKQTDLNSVIKVIERNALKGTHLPMTINVIQTGYLTSPYFKNIYLYPAQNRLPSSKATI